MRRRAAVVACLVSALTMVAATPVVAGEADSPPQPLSPKQHAVVPVNANLTFKVKDVGHAYHHEVWISISSSKKLDRTGRLIDDAHGTFAGMHRHAHGIYTYTPPHYTYPEWFLVRPGKYYWQVFHTNCSAPNAKGCNVYGKLRAFYVR